MVGLFIEVVTTMGRRSGQRLIPKLNSSSGASVLTMYKSE